MNDRYLFRAKRTDDGEWVEGNRIDDGVTGQVFIHASGNTVNESDKVGEDGCLRFVAFEVDPSTICQCIGLKDKHGKLIFENDIVRCGENCTVTWCDTFASWRLNTSRWMHSHFFGEACEPEDVEIVGNIFDNPELLEAGCDQK